MQFVSSGFRQRVEKVWYRFKPIVWEYIKYNLYGGLCFWLATGVFYVLMNYHPLFAWFFTNIVIGDLLSYFIQRHLVFRSNKG